MLVLQGAQTATPILSLRCVWTFAPQITSLTFQRENAGKIASHSSSTSLIKAALYIVQPPVTFPLIFTWIPIPTVVSTNVFPLGTLTIPPDIAHRLALVLFWLITLLDFV